MGFPFDERAAARQDIRKTLSVRAWQPGSSCQVKAQRIEVNGFEGGLLRVKVQELPTTTIRTPPQWL